MHVSLVFNVIEAEPAEPLIVRYSGVSSSTLDRVDVRRCRKLKERLNVLSINVVAGERLQQQKQHKTAWENDYYKITTRIQ